jgi:hypothetical protein
MLTLPSSLKAPTFIYAAIIFLHLILRFYQLTTPLADWHSFRQADTASVAREFVKNGIDLMRPRYHDFSNIQSGKDNLEGYRMVEFPLIQGLVAATYSPLINIIPTLELHVWYRLINIIFSTISLILLIKIGSHLFNQQIGLIAGLVFALLPYNIFYSRAILPEVAMVAFSLSALYLSLLSLRSNKGGVLYALALVSAIALLIKPVAVFFLLPSLYIAILDLLSRPRRIGHYLLVALIAVVPLFLWRQWIQNFPEGIPASDWLLNGNGIRLRPAWFRWLFYERLTKLILGYFGLIPLLFGISVFFKPKPPSSTFHHLKSKIYSLFKPKILPTIEISPKLFTAFWLLGGFLYLIVFATGNVQHDYYQIPQIPALSLILALGIWHLWQSKSPFLKVLLLVTCSMSLIFSWQTIKTYYHINHWAIVRAGKVADQLLPQDATVIAPYMGDTAFLYQTNRKGWPIGHDIEDKIAKGATHYISVNYDDEARNLESRYKTISKTEEYIILNLIK